jgi:heme-degrading monooxygenase HmoA
VTLITAFEVPPEADEAFVAALSGTGTLHRALRADVDFRYVVVGREPVPALPFAAHAGRYEIVHADGAPDGDQGVTLINAFEVAETDDDEFLAGWGRARDVLAAQPGYLGTRLHRSVEPADFRFVNIARWSSPLAFARALKQPAFEPVAAATARFAAHPALYLVVRRPVRTE